MLIILNYENNNDISDGITSNKKYTFYFKGIDIAL